ncbi:hypothetical protein MSG28_013091 [Choristoneura fumiferana]|uniref:Uncharacterized protein n=1 Tax=Choristoneura fumiferana TaxID=7141 RepID=A0ACC0KRZ3_CHOFU|nr:hypothetical protein MSG28_013091 [Choristoneura fumiferana]
MMNTNTFRIMMLMFIAALVMNVMNYFFCSLHSSRRPAPARVIENKFIQYEYARAGVEEQTESKLLDKLMGTGGPIIVISSVSEYDTTTDSLTTTSTFGTTPRSPTTLRLGNAATSKNPFFTT